MSKQRKVYPPPREQLWSVQIIRKDGTSFIALGNDGGVFTTWHRKNAVAFKRALAAQQCNIKRTKVVPVTVAMRREG